MPEPAPPGPGAEGAAAGLEAGGAAAGPEAGGRAAGPEAGGAAAGRLVLVGTPIGNLRDATPRALDALRHADVICAEDTRRTRKLLSAFGITPRRLVSVRAHNEQREAARAARWVTEGRCVAYVSDAGMPALSDPGERLARAVVAAGGEVSVCPGADAATAALLASGLGAGRWSFEGFLPARGAARRRRLAGIGGEAGAVVLFEAPHRLRRTLADLAEHAGAGRGVLVANDLTKRFERTWRGTVGTVGEQVGTGEPRGEFVIVLAPADRTGPRRGPTPAGGSAPAGV